MLAFGLSMLASAKQYHMSLQFGVSIVLQLNRNLYKCGLVILIGSREREQKSVYSLYENCFL